MTETVHVIVQISVNAVVLCRRQLHIFCYIYMSYILHLTLCMPPWKQCHQHTDYFAAHVMQDTQP